MQSSGSVQNYLTIIVKFYNLSLYALYIISGAFLLVYFIAMALCGVPIFFQEVAIGQYLGSGGMTLVAQLCPILKGKYHFVIINVWYFLKKSTTTIQYWDIPTILGVGIATMALVFFLDIYYCVIIAWTFFYFIAAFTAIPDLPWNTCGEYSSI